MSRIPRRFHRARSILLCVTASTLLVAGGCSIQGDPALHDKRDVVVFLLDAARADHFGCYGYAKNTTPHIDALAKTSIVFESAISEAASTFPSTSALMTGLSTRESRLLKTQPLPTTIPTLAEKAERAGYRTYAYSENPFVTSTFGFDRGFSGFDEAFPHEDFANIEGELPEFDTREHILEALNWMARESSEPFFAYFHLLRPHNPYNAPSEIVERFAADADPSIEGGTDALLDIDQKRRNASAEELERIIGLYDANLAYGDQLFGFLLDGMRSRNLLDNAIIVVLSDHGEGFLEHGRMLHTSTVFDEMIRVPLIIHHPDSRNAMRIEAPIQLRDVGNGIARIFEHRADEIRGDGSTFVPVEALRGESNRLTISRTLPRFGLAAIRSRGHKLVMNIGTEGCLSEPLAIYDLQTDPEERDALPVSDRPVVGLFARHFEEHGAWECDEHSGEPEVEVDPTVAARLRALGYLE